MRLALVCVALTASSGCAFGDGDYFAELAPTLEARHVVPAERDVGGGWLAVGDGYAVSLSQLSVDLHELELMGVTPAAAGGDEHGHDHGGADEPDDEDAARVIVALPVGDIDLLAGYGPVALDCEPACGLPRADIEAAVAHLEAFSIAGSVRDETGAERIAGEIAFAFAIDEVAARPSASMELVAGDDEPYDVALHLTLEATVELLDGVRWDALSLGDDGFDLSDSPASVAAVTDALGAVSLTAEVTR